jgi:hypothetical protein
MSETLTRYELTLTGGVNYMGAELETHPYGDWVRYDDAQAALTRAEQAREAAEQQINVVSMKLFLELKHDRDKMNKRALTAEAERDTLRAQLDNAEPK